MNNLIKNWAISQALEYSKRTILIAFITTVIVGYGIRFIILDDNIMNMLPKDMDSRRVWEEIVKEFKYSDFLFVAFGKENKDVLTSENLKLVWDLSEAFEAIDQVEEVLSLSTMSRIDGDDGFLEVNDLMPDRILDVSQIESLSKYLKNNSNLSSQILSKSEDYINIIIRPKSSREFPVLVSAVIEVIKPYETSYEFHLGGQPYIAGKVPGMIQTETRQLILIGLFIMSIILLFNLRNLPSVGMILLIIVMSMISMLGCLGWIYKITGSPSFIFTFIHSSMPIVLLTIANSDGVHVLSRFFRQARKNKDIKKAIINTMNQLLLPIFLTSITTSAAFLTMLSSPINAMSGYGLAIGFGILWAWLLSSIFLPALINLKKWNFSTAAFTNSSFLENIVSFIGRLILKQPKKVLSAGILVVILSSIGIQHINVEVNLVNLFKTGNTIRESTKFLDRKMAGSMNLIMKIKGDLKEPELLSKMVRVQDYLETTPTVNTTVSIANIIEEMHKVIMNNNPDYNNIPDSRDKVNNLFTMYSMSGDPDDFQSLVNYEYNTGIITAMMHTVSTNEVIKMADDINNFLETEIAGLDIEVSGLMMFLKDFVTLVVQSSITSIIVSIGVILSIAWIFFRSWKFGLLAVIPLSSAIVINFGLMGWLSVDLSHFTALLTSIIIGVGVDFAIHYISEFRFYSKKGLDASQINTQVIDDVGYPILLDVCSNMGFAALIFSSLIPIVHMGGLMVFAMLSTSFGTLTILASVMEIKKQNLYAIGNK